MSGQYNLHGSEEPETKRSLRDVVEHGNTIITSKW
jgi:hypothetical protein